MARPVDDPSGSNQLTDPTDRVVPLSELRATVAELMKEAAEAQKERQPRPDDPGKSQTGRVTVLSLGNTSEMTGLRPPTQGEAQLTAVWRGIRNARGHAILDGGERRIA